MPEKERSIKDFKQLISLLKGKHICKRAVVVWPEESHTQEAVSLAAHEGFIKPILICSETTRNTFAQKEGFETIIVDSPEEASRKAVALIREKQADIIMKGFVNTDVLLRAILDKQLGILPKGAVLTHIAVAKLAEYNKLIFFTDAAVIPYPTDEQRKAQVQYLVDFCHAFNITCPKISLIHCSEKVDTKHFPHTANYLTLKEDAKAGVFGKCEIDGPLDLKTSCSKEAMEIKQINSPINGEADALIFPNIESGNLFYKTITLFCHAEVAGVLQGTMAPVVLPSRGDTINSKLYSLALASLIVK
ncbi:MAG: phosphate butyryltransferase [Prevotella sp.]|nr:phosphate butyryltransferase [Prevotella sp.]